MRSRKKEEKKDLLFPLLDFNCPINQYDYSDDDGSEDNFNATTSEIDKYSYKPRKYLKELNCYLNNEKKIADEGTFYQDSMLAILPKIVLLPNGSQPNYMPSDFIQSNENPPLNLLTKTDYETDSIPKVSKNNILTYYYFVYYKNCSKLKNKFKHLSLSNKPVFVKVEYATTLFISHLLLMTGIPKII